MIAPFLVATHPRKPKRAAQPQPLNVVSSTIRLAALKAGGGTHIDEFAKRLREQKKAGIIEMIGKARYDNAIALKFNAFRRILACLYATLRLAINE